ncbi:MAG: hypothetical protein CSA26_00120 [Desulfobacterales bacterium]|nr:MAG: hypothetical protein CSA26_00120 [Desulfobacterales bacterium]
MDSTLKYHVKEYTTEHFSVCSERPASQFFDGIRMKIDKETALGWTELLRIHNGLYVEMVDYRAKQHFTTCHNNMEIPFKFCILLSGRFDSQFPGQGEKHITSGEIWCVHGSFEKTLYNYFPNEKVCAVSICLPRNVIETWLGTSCCVASSGLEKLVLGRLADGLPGQAFPLARGLRQSSKCLRIARQLISVNRQTLTDNLCFESLGLDLLSHILTLKDSLASSYMERTRRIRVAVDEAVDILRRKWNDPPSISDLARQVGINECYLKREFRQQMDMSIGGYIRQQRMKKALELIETGRYSILETALFVGYSNPSYFSAAFKKFYGNLPSYYLPKDGTTC